MFKSLHNKRFLPLAALSAALCSMTLVAAPVRAQTAGAGEPNHVVVGSIDDEANGAAGVELIEPFTTAELEDLVSPVALYPDDLLAIVLPAAAYPLQIVQAARFLDELENDASLQPHEDWDESVVALLNYPEVIDLLNSDLEWTWKLGEAVLNQEAEVIEAVETFRDRAMLAGNLQTDEHQVVSNEDGTIEITPVDEEVIYVPYYEPEQVVVYQRYPVYHYYPSAYPVYYYPYPTGYYFNSGYFWGITTAYTIGWRYNYLNVYLWDYYSHPYYGRTYYNNNHYYHRWSRNHRRSRHAGNPRHRGDRWRPNRGHGARPGYRQPRDGRHAGNGRGGDSRRGDGRRGDGRRGDGRRGDGDGRRGGDSFVSTRDGSRFGQPGTFKRRPGFQGKVVNAGNTRSGDTVSNSRRDRRSARTRDARKPSQRDGAWKNNATPETKFNPQNRRSSNNARRNRPDRDQRRNGNSGEPVVQNKARGNRVNNRVARSAEPRRRVSNSATPSNQRRSNQGRSVKRSDSSREVRASRPSPVANNRSRGRSADVNAHSRSREARPSSPPRQSRPASRPPQSRAPQSRPPQARAPKSRPAPAASRPSPPARSDRGRSESRGGRGNSSRDGRGRHR